MDGVSSALAVASFSIQLISTVRRAQKFLKEVRDAPEELENLAGTLDQLEHLLMAINGLVEQQNAIDNLPGAVDMISSALQNCQITIRRLDDAIAAVYSRFGRQSRSRKAWESLRMVVKKDQIEKIRKQIQDNMINLQLALTLNSSHLHLHQLKLLSTRQSITSTTTNIVTTDICITPELNNLGTTSSDYSVTTKGSSTILYTGLFGTVKGRTRTKFIRSSSKFQTISEEKCLLYTPSLFSMVLELQYDARFFRIPKSLNVVQILDRDFMFDVCVSSELDYFTQALSDGKFSLFARDKHGRTFLHIACMFMNSKLCSLLMSLGVESSHLDDSGAKALHFIDDDADSQVEILRALTTGREGFEAEDLSLLTDDRFSGSPDCADFLLSKCTFSDETYYAIIKDLSLLKLAVREYGSGNVQWHRSIRKWLRRKPDIHLRSFASEIHLPVSCRINRCRRSQFLEEHPEMTFTLLDELFAFTEDPFQAEVVATEWLSMLTEAEYDVNMYLEDEKRLHLAQDFLSFPEFESDLGKPRQISFEIGENPKVSWDWWNDPSSHANLVLREFRHVNLCLDQDRSYAGFSSEFWSQTWPFNYTHWSTTFEPHVYYRTEREDWRKRADQAARRYDRQAKKKYPEYFKDIAEGVVVPGAWVEDDF